MQASDPADHAEHLGRFKPDARIVRESVAQLLISIENELGEMLAKLLGIGNQGQVFPRDREELSECVAGHGELIAGPFLLRGDSPIVDRQSEHGQDEEDGRRRRPIACGGEPTEGPWPEAARGMPEPADQPASARSRRRVAGDSE